MISSLVARGVDINGWDTSAPSEPALVRAVEKGQKRVIELLVAKGADLNAKDRSNQTALDVALNQNQKDIVELLIAKGAEVSIHTAVRLGDVERMRSLLERGADVNARDMNGATPLHLATNKDIAELLPAKGADIKAKDSEGKTPLDAAMQEYRQEITKLLAVKGVEVSVHVAAFTGDIDKVKAFMGDGGSVDTADTDGQTLLHWAAGNHKDIAEMLVSHGANVNAVAGKWRTPSGAAARTGGIEVAEYLIAHGANVNTGEGYWTPLQEAAYYSKEMVELLLAKGANINAGKWTALHSALDGGRFDIAELLLAKGADVNARDDDGSTPLHLAASSYAAEKKPNVVELLLSKGADIDAKDNGGRTPLSCAKESGHIEIAELLLQSDSRTNEQDASARTFLGQAARKPDGQEEGEVTHDARLPRLDVERGKYGTYLTIRSESIPGLLLDVWCYEDRLGEATKCEKQEGVVVLIHKLEEATVTTRFEHSQIGVDIQVRVTGPTAEAMQNVKGVNPCCQFGRSAAFRSEGNYVDDFVARCFVFLDAGMTLLKDTERIPGTLPGKDDKANYPKPWIQEYFPTWCRHPGQVKGERGYSPDRPVYPIIGVVSRDGKYLAAIAWPETASLGQVWHHCIHPRPLIAESFDAQTAETRSCGKIYSMENDEEKLLRRFKENFPHWRRPPDVR